MPIPTIKIHLKIKKNRKLLRKKIKDKRLKIGKKYINIITNSLNNPLLSHIRINIYDIELFDNYACDNKIGYTIDRFSVDMLTIIKYGDIAITKILNRYLIDAYTDDFGHNEFCIAFLRRSSEYNNPIMTQYILDIINNSNEIYVAMYKLYFDKKLSFSVTKLCVDKICYKNNKKILELLVEPYVGENENKLLEEIIKRDDVTFIEYINTKCNSIILLKIMANIKYMYKIVRYNAILIIILFSEKSNEIFGFGGNDGLCNYLLRISCYLKNTQICRFLIDEVTCSNKIINKVFLESIQYSSVEIAKLFLDRGVNIKNYKSVIKNAKKIKNYKLVKYLQTI